MVDGDNNNDANEGSGHDNNDDDNNNDDDDDDDDNGRCGGRDGHHRMRKGRGHDNRTTHTQQ